MIYENLTCIGQRNSCLMSEPSHRQAEAQSSRQSNTEVTSRSRITTSEVAYYGNVVEAAKPPTFSDEENTITVENWTTRMAIIFRVHNIPHKFRARIAAMYLREYPAVWWEVSQDETMKEMTWNRFRFSIERQFSQNLGGSLWERRKLESFTDSDTE